MDKQQSDQIIALVKRFSAVKLLYFFGSRSNGDYGPLSDYDFGVFCAPFNSESSMNVKMELTARISLILKSDQIDVVVLNSLTAPELAYEVINGKLIYEEEPYKIVVEPLILNRYFDFKLSLQKNNLIKT